MVQLYPHVCGLGSESGMVHSNGSHSHETHANDDDAGEDVSLKYLHATNIKSLSNRKRLDKLLRYNLKHFRRPRFTVPCFCYDIAIKVRFMGNQQDTAFVRLKSTLQFILRIDIQVVRRLIEHE